VMFHSYVNLPEGMYFFFTAKDASPLTPFSDIKSMYPRLCSAFAVPSASDEILRDAGRSATPCHVPLKPAPVEFALRSSSVASD
jgi:hypothetical protein